MKLKLTFVYVHRNTSLTQIRECTGQIVLLQRVSCMIAATVKSTTNDHQKLVFTLYCTRTYKIGWDFTHMLQVFVSVALLGLFPWFGGFITGPSIQCTP